MRLEQHGRGGALTLLVAPAYLVPGKGSGWNKWQRSVYCLPDDIFPPETMTISEPEFSKNDAQAWARIVPRDEEIDFMAYVALDRAMGMGVPFWDLLTPGKESDGLLPSSTPSHSIPVHVPPEVPGQDS